MPTTPLPHKIAQLSHEIKTLKESILHLEAPVTSSPTAAAGSLLETMTASLIAIDSAEQQERSRLTKLEALRNLLTDALQTLEELGKMQARSKPLYDGGIIRLEKTRKKFNKAIDAVLSTWDEFQAALKSIEDDALTQAGAVPFHRAEYPMDSDWLRGLGKISPMNAQGYYPIVRGYEYDRLHTDGE